MIWAVLAIVVAVLAFATFAIVTLRSEAHARSAAERRADLADVAKERAEYERDKATTELAAEHKRAVALEAYANELEATDNRDLDAADIAGRMRRLLARTGAEAAGDQVPAEPAAEVRDEAGATPLSRAGADALLRPE